MRKGEKNIEKMKGIGKKQLKDRKLIIIDQRKRIVIYLPIINKQLIVWEPIVTDLEVLFDCNIYFDKGVLNEMM